MAMMMMVALVLLLSNVYAWNYQRTSSTGPYHWGDTWSTCGTGAAQSPMDLPLVADRYFDINLDNITFHYYNDITAAAITRTSNSLSIDTSNGTAAIMNGPLHATYTLKKISLHLDGEHTVAGGRYPLELQLHHESSSTSLKHAIISVLISEMSPSEDEPDVDNAIIAPIVDALSTLLPLTNTSIQITLPLSTPLLLTSLTDELINNADGNYFYSTYMGSLSTPSCDEGVTHIIMHQILTASGSQIETIRMSLAGVPNSRPIQSTNNRVVSTSEPPSDESTAVDAEAEEAAATMTRVRKILFIVFPVFVGSILAIIGYWYCSNTGCSACVCECCHASATKYEQVPIVTTGGPQLPQSPVASNGISVTVNSDTRRSSAAKQQ